MNAAAEKQALRHTMLARRKAMARDARDAADAAITAGILAQPAIQTADMVLAYVSMPHEVGTKQLLEALLAAGKTVGLPVCNTADHTMQFYRLDAMHELQTGAYRIPIPPTDAHRLLTPTAETVCLVPMLAYDESGHRLGAGGGYYDRFLAAYPVQTIGICYADCKLTQLPHERYDRPLSCCVTEQKTEVFYG